MGLRIGLIGVGQRSALALEVARATGPGSGARVVACADPSSQGQRTARELFGPEIAVQADHRSLLAAGGLDAVMVLTPDHLHIGPVIDALKAGVAVFAEKPLAITTADCDLILNTAQSTGTRLYVGHNLRHAPVIRAMRRLIDGGAIGRVRAVWCRHFVGRGGDYYFKDWHAERANTTGLLLQKGAHDLDVIHWLAGGSTRLVTALGQLSVYGEITDRRARDDSERVDDWFDDANWPPGMLTGLNPVVDVEDLSMLTGRLDNGVLISYQECHFTPDYWRNYTVIGDHGRLENFGDLEGAQIKVWNARRSGYRRDADQVIDVPAGDGLHSGADAALIGEFLRFVAVGGPTETSPVAAREAVAAGYAATASLRSAGAPIQIDPLNPELVRYFAAGQPGSRAPSNWSPSL